MAEGVAALIMRHIFARFGAPKKFISDRDTRFTSKVAREYCNKFKIQQNMSTAYHPRTDGRAERTNQEADIYLHMYCDKRQNDWHLWLPLAEFAHNQHPSATTGQTPFSMIMGYMPKVEWPSAPSQVPSYTTRMEQIEQVQEVARTSLDKAQKMIAIRNAGHKKFRPYRKGDLVWIEGTNLKTLYPSAKLAPKRYGPFKIMEQLSPAVYSIKILQQWKVHNVFHANLITPYKEMSIHGPNFSRPPPDLIDGEEEFEVEQILDMKQMGRGCKTHYLVKWKGYPTSDNSWEPEKNLNADELIADFKWSFRPKKTKAKKVFIRAGQTTHIDSSPSHLYHNTLLFPKEMSSESAASLHVPSTSLVRASSLPPSSAPSTSPSPDSKVPTNYKYIGADHCGVCCLPLQYDHIHWSQGLFDGYTCCCGRSSSEPSPPEPTPEEAPTPQLACHTLPMPESNNDEDSEVNYEDPVEPSPESQPLVPPLGYITNNP